MSDNKAQKFFLYARKSTDDAGKQVLSIESQLTEVREYAKKEKFFIVKEFVEKRSAKKPGRPVFNKLLAGIEAGEARGILAWSPDRLARNAVDAGKIIHLLDRGKLATLKFPSFWFDKTPQGLFMLNIAFGESKYFIDNLSQNTKRGIRQKLRRGEFPGYAPIGYLNELRTHNIVKDPEQWKAVRRLFEKYATGKYTLEELQKLALSLGLHSQRSASSLSKSQIHRMLENPFYYGLFKYKGELYEGTHEPIISKQLFEKVQQVLKNRRKPRKNRDYNWKFLGVFTCGECGRSITAEQKIKGSGLVFRYYRCTKKGTNCTQRYLCEKDLVKQLNGIFQKVALPDDWAEPIFNKLDRKEKEIAQSSVSFTQNLQREIQLIDNKLSKILDMQLDGVITIEEYKQKKEELINRKMELKQKLNDFGRKGNYWLGPMRNFISDCQQAPRIARSENLEEKRSFLQKIGSDWKITDKKIEFSPQNAFVLMRRYEKFSQFPTWGG